MSERADQRIDAAVGAVIRANGVTEPCLTRTLSSRGASIATQKTWPIGTVVEVELVHQGARVHATARIVSQTQGGVGVEFIDAAPTAQRAIAKLVAGLVGAADSTRAEPPEELRDVSWSLAESGGGLSGLIRGRQHRARLIDVSVDGAALACKSPPEIGAEILVHLANHLPHEGKEDTVQSAARVVRHTEHGFAVRFVTPSAIFRRVVSEIRKAARR